MKNRLKEMRETKRLTQKEVGEKVGVSRQAINAIETGKFDPSIWLAYDLAKLFDLSIEELFDFEGGKENEATAKSVYQCCRHHYHICFLCSNIHHYKRPR